jgi:hypothetical protein
MLRRITSFRVDLYLTPPLALVYAHDWVASRLAITFVVTVMGKSIPLPTKRSEYSRMAGLDIRRD